MDTHNSNLNMLIQRRAPKRGNRKKKKKNYLGLGLVKFLNDEKVETLTTS